MSHHNGTKKPHHGKFLGKYRATVLTNIDPLQMGRLLVAVSDVSGLLPSTWAMPCVPVAGIQHGFFALPIPGSGVWVEFEQGDPDFPIWVGCYWGSAAEVPMQAQLLPPLIPGVTIQTPLQSSIQVSDMPPTPLTGGVVLRSGTGVATLTVNDTGIYLSYGPFSVMLTPAGVSVNQGALVVI
jgi:hypothetical protein